MAGLYLSEDEEGNAEELAAVGPLVEEYGDILDAVIVGNEVRAVQTNVSLYLSVCRFCLVKP